LGFLFLIPCLLVSYSGAEQQVDTAFSDANWGSMGPTPDPNFNVAALAPSSSGIFAAGRASDSTGRVLARVAKWDGARWSSLDLGEPGYVKAIAVSGSELYVGGFFKTMGRVPVSNFAKWDGSRCSAMPQWHGSAHKGHDADVFILKFQASLKLCSNHPSQPPILP
jgi:hypothetical protein